MLAFIEEVINIKGNPQAVEVEHRLIDRLLKFFSDVQDTLSDDSRKEFVDILIKRSMSKFTSQQSVAKLQMSSDEIIRRSRMIHLLVQMI